MMNGWAGGCWLGNREWLDDGAYEYISGGVIESWYCFWAVRGLDERFISWIDYLAKIQKLSEFSMRENDRESLASCLESNRIGNVPFWSWADLWFGCSMRSAAFVERSAAVVGRLLWVSFGYDWTSTHRLYPGDIALLAVAAAGSSGAGCSLWWLSSRWVRRS